MVDMQQIRKELQFSAVKSGGPGGQNVNKVSTTAQLTWDYQASQALSPQEKSLIQKRLRNRINKQNQVYIRSNEFRDLERNKERSIEKLEKLIKKALHRKKPRKPTRPSRASQIKAREKKEQRSKIKQLRKKPDF